MTAFWNRLGALFRRHDPRNPQGLQIRSDPLVIKGDTESRFAVSRSPKGAFVTDQFAWEDQTSPPENREYDYAAPYEGSDETAEADLIEALSSTRAFRRLKGIRFLGALDYLLVARPNGRVKRYTRYQHSFGVAALAKSYLRLREHSAEQRLLCVAAAMLHDVGHPPFSHTLEPVFEEAFGVDHHLATEQLITGLVPLGSQIVQVLKSFGVDPLAVLHLLNGGDELFEGFFSGPINFDTIEGILRARKYLGMQNLGLTPLKVMTAAAERSDPDSKEVVDQFWQSKHEVYTLVIRSPQGVFYDGLFQAIARAHIDHLSAEDIYATEDAVFKRIPLLRDALSNGRVREIAERVLPKEIPYQHRRFYVVEDTEFDSHHDDQRYRQRKSGTSLTVRDFLRV